MTPSIYSFKRFIAVARILASAEAFKEHWFRYTAERGTRLTDSRGNSLMLRSGMLFSVQEFNKKQDKIRVAEYPKYTFSLPIQASEALMEKAGKYKGKPPHNEKAAKPLATLPHKISVAPMGAKAKVKKTPRTSKIGITLPGVPDAMPITPPREKRSHLPVLPQLEDDYEDLDGLGLDFGDHSFSGEIVPGGVYSSVSPDADSVKALKRVSHLVNFLEPEDDFHCTILYSRNAGRIEETPQSALDTDVKYAARIERFLVWSGHDKAKYLVGLLHSPDLHKINRDWTDLGYTVDFDEFQPHITLKSKIDHPRSEEAVTLLNNYVKMRGGVELQFGPQAIEPLKD